jgi:signal transduction histidine kinase
VHALVRALWEEPRPPAPPARVWRDGVLVAVLVTAAVLEGLFRAEMPHRPLSVALTVALVPLVLFRRTHPLTVVLVAFLASGLAALLTAGTPPGSHTMAFVLLLPYALFRWGSGREIVAGSVVMAARLAQGALVDRVPPQETFGGAAVLLATCAVGTAIRYRSRSHARELDRAKLLERENLARDLHDTVAHHVSAIAVRAQAGLAAAATQPDAATDALRIIEAEASRTLAEMRGMVRVLRRGEPADLRPGPRIPDIAGLADGPGHGAAGPVVDVAVTGDLAGVPEPVSAAIYRLAQESVTNARRHARHATRIEVRVAADASAVRLTVRDDGEAAPLRQGPPGYGLVGMAERAELLGGTCEAGPDPARGWTVTAVLPRAGWDT